MTEVLTGREALPGERRRAERAARKARIKAAKERDQKSRNDLLLINKQLQEQVRRQKFLIKGLLARLAACENACKSDKSSTPDAHAG